MVFAFEELHVYRKALDFSAMVIGIIDEIDTPRKHYRLIEQLEAACTSVPMNIAEGKGRHSKKEFKQFLFVARGSLYETIAMLQIFRKKSWLDTTKYEALYTEAEEINKMISGLINTIVTL
jgi:four helix bundle protein